MSKSSPEEREELESKARALINEEGTPGILVQLYVMLANDMQHMGSTVGEVRGILIVLVPLTIASLVYQVISSL